MRRRAASRFPAQTEPGTRGCTISSQRGAHGDSSMATMVSPFLRNLPGHPSHPQEQESGDTLAFGDARSFRVRHAVDSATLRTTAGLPQMT